MNRMLIASVVTVLGWTGGALAEGETSTAAAPEAAPEMEAAAAPVESVADRILRAMRLPETATQAREAGVPAEAVTEMLESARTEGVSATVAETALEEGARHVREGGDPNEFKNFVHARIGEHRDLKRASREAGELERGKRDVDNVGQDVREKAHEGKERMHEAAEHATEEAREDAEHAAETAKAKAEEAAHHGKQEAKKLEKHGKDAKDKAHEAKPKSGH
ncbi:MAG: hypothetical protein KC591_17315 [Gemmatimonadetes bacterium]|nr:hypothetical protein [Gemmatimonadota bacterium]